MATVYFKINNLTYFQVEKANQGKIINIIAGDLNNIENKVHNYF